jgi:hypothetical protein
MSFDLSRKTFNALDDYFGVVMQQGRVQLDADWNTMVDQISRRLQAESLDTFGPAVVPRVTPEGFLISGPASGFEIGPGRIYVDGLLAENHTETLKWDARLAEISGTAKLSGADIDAAPSGVTGTTAYDDQPYYPNPPDLPAGENLLVYLDVWQRDITHLQDADLVDTAVGVDTTARRQTVWQVRYLGGVGAIDAATADADIPGWLEAIHPSSARLSTDTGDLTDDDNPCLLQPQAGYKGLENQLYRVQVHDGGPLGTATFKWSRDNAIVASRVSAMPSGNQIVVESLGRDDVLAFHEGDWVEVTDDHRDLMGLPGEIRRIQLGGGIDTATRTITLEGSPLPIGSGAGEFPVKGSNQTYPGRNTRVIRWDQSGLVFREDESEHADLDAASSSGVIEIPAAGTRLFLEKGILVDFDLEDVVAEASFGPVFKTGDNWTFAARVNDASIETLDRAPPQGIHHHFAKLAIIDSGNIIDCRTLWPPEMGGEGCACTVCVEPEGHNNGTATIQQAIDQVVAAGGGTVCLSVGRYNIGDTIRISGNSVALRGQGWQTMLVAQKPLELIEIGGEAPATNVSIENLFGITTVTSGARPAVAVRNVFGLDIKRCFLTNVSGEMDWGDSVRRGTSLGVKFSGLVALARVKDCLIIAERGIVGPTNEKEFLATIDLVVNHCMMSCKRFGISFDGLSLHLNRLDLTRNYIAGAVEAGIGLTGATAGGSEATIRDNLLMNCERGIRAGVSNLRILTNDLEEKRTEKSGGDAISLVGGLLPTPLSDQQLIGNRIRNYNGHAISVETAVGRMMVKQNQVENITGAGFVVGPTGSIEQLSLENNQFRNIDGVLPGKLNQQAAIRLQASQRADIANNLLERVVSSPRPAESRIGIDVVSSAQVSVRNNRLLSVTAANYTGFGAGIAISSLFGSFTVEGNEVSRVPDFGDEELDNFVAATWIPLLVRGRRPPVLLGEGMDMERRRDTLSGGLGVMIGSVAESLKFTTTAPVVKEKGRAYAVLATHIVDLGRLAAAKNDVRADGNYLDGTSTNTFSVVAVAATHCGLSGNEIRSLNVGPTALVMAHHVAFNHNRLIAPSEELVLIPTQRYVVMGNMHPNGNIRVLQEDKLDPLPPPWDALNIRL